MKTRSRSSRIDENICCAVDIITRLLYYTGGTAGHAAERVGNSRPCIITARTTIPPRLYRKPREMAKRERERESARLAAFCAPNKPGMRDGH